jgi:phosphoserine phosphatase RsbU/P
VTDTRLQQIRKLTEVSRALTYAVSLDEVFQLTVDHAANLLAAEKSLLMVADEDGRLVLRASHGVDGDLPKRVAEPFTEALVPRLAELLGAGSDAFLGVPLVLSGEIKGILFVIRSTPATAAEQDEWLLSALADQAAVALEKARLDEMGAFREELIGIVGHDLRSPLNTILLATRVLLLREGLGEMETELARKITRSASAAARLIDLLLDLTRSRLGGGIPIEPKRFDMHDVCRQVIDETELTNPDRPLRVDLVGDLVGVWDRDRMYQLLSNLVGNAVQHGAARSAIDVRINGEKTELLIEVANRGEPIPPTALPFIFNAFRQGRSTHTARKHGLGLGLFIGQQIARAHGGLISVTSSESDGTTFSVRLPRSAPAVAREPSAAL